MARTQRKTRNPHSTVLDVAHALDQLAPPELAQGWDNVGLIAGDRSAPVRRILLCIDLTPEVVDEASGKHVDFVMAYHPPIFKPISRLVTPGPDMDAVVHHCIRNGIALYSMHTALDAADGGTNDVLADLCGIKNPQPLETTDAPGPPQAKIVVFVPPGDTEKVADAMFDAGAGHIGQYSRCSYRLRGTGSFFGGAQTQPTVGRANRFERIDEVRLETIVDRRDVAGVVAAMRAVHPYDEAAFDIYPLNREPVRGIGRVGNLAKPTTLGRLARKLKRATDAPGVLVVGRKDRTLSRAVIVAGAAGSLPFQIPLNASDVIVTGEIRHHDALSILRRGACAIALGHASSERPVLETLASRLQTLLPNARIESSQVDAEPLTPL